MCHLECFERDKKRYQGQKTISGTKNDIRDKKRYQGDISFLCPPVTNLIKAQVCNYCDVTITLYRYSYILVCFLVSLAPKQRKL